MKYLSLIFLLFLIGCKKDNSHFDVMEGEPINLIGTNWSLYQSNEISSIDNNGLNYPIIRFGSDGILIQSSCNLMNGKMVLTSSSFTFESLFTTYAFCNENVRMIEAYFHELADDEISYKYSKGVLYFFNGDKAIGSFKRIND